MRDRIFKAFDGVNLSESKRKKVLDNVLEGSMGESNMKKFWQGKMGGAVIIAAAALIFVAVNVVLLGGNGDKTPLNNSSGDVIVSAETTGQSAAEQQETVQLIEETAFEPTTVAVENETTTGICAYPPESVAHNDIEYKIASLIATLEEMEALKLSISMPPDVSDIKEVDSMMISLPVKNGQITAEFGVKYNVMHYGTDFAPNDDRNVYAVSAGTVIMAEYAIESGNTIKIDHGNGVVSEYGSLEAMDVSVGEKINAGDVIGIIGNTGCSTGVHLCWKMSVNGEYVDPMSLLNR